MTKEDYEKHHIWCNFAMFRRVEECKQCKGLFKDYPMEGLTPDELMKKHFPNNVIRR